MTTLTETTLKINTDVQAIVADALAAAANAHQEFVAQHPNWSLSLADMEQVYLQTWGEAHGIDLVAAQFPTVDEINAALLDDPDYADFLAQTMTGIPQF